MGSNINCFTLMNDACKKLKGKFGKAFLGTLIVVAILVAISFIPYYVGIVLSVLISGYLFFGLIEYYKKLFNNENPSLKVIFTNYSKIGAATLIGIINFAALSLGFVLLIFPAIAYMIYYGLNLHILSDQKETKVLEAFNDNSTRMVANKTLVLSYKILNYFLMLLVVTICGLVLVPVSALYATNVALSIFLGLLVVLVGIVLLTLVVVLYQATQMEFYLNHLIPLDEANKFIEARNNDIIAKRQEKLEAKANSKKECCHGENCECHKEKECHKEECHKEKCEHKEEKECPHCKNKEEKVEDKKDSTK